MENDMSEQPTISIRVSKTFKFTREELDNHRAKEVYKTWDTMSDRDKATAAAEYDFNRYAGAMWVLGIDKYGEWDIEIL